MARSKTKAPGQVDFTRTPSERKLISLIAERAWLHARAPGCESFAGRSKLDWEMDITACHRNGTPLDLKKLCDIDHANFAHDVFGIARHLDRKTGELRNFFVPRCARSEAVPDTEVA